MNLQLAGPEGLGGVIAILVFLIVCFLINEFKRK